MSKLSKKQRKIAKAAKPFNKITRADFIKLKKKNKNGRKKT